MRGRWIFDLLFRVAQRNISLKEALGFFRARISKKPTHFALENIQFTNADHIMWSIAWEIFLARQYCPKGFEIHENDIVVDIGAHRGIFTAFAANRTKGEIISIEPDPNNFQAIRKLCDENKWSQVKTIFGAISQKSGTISLFNSNISSRHSIYGIDPVTLQEREGSISVPSYTLEDILKDISNVDLMKIDCEGSEYEILLNSGDQLDKVKRISMEIHFQTPNADPDALVKYLRGKYRYVSMVVKNKLLGYLFASHQNFF